MINENKTMEPDSTGTHIIQVVGANAAALGITFASINEMLTALSLTLATGYTLYKWIKDLSSKKK
jgi:hypothetical protein